VRIGLRGWAWDPRKAAPMDPVDFTVDAKGNVAPAADAEVDFVVGAPVVAPTDTLVTAAAAAAEPVSAPVSKESAFDRMLTAAAAVMGSAPVSGGASAETEAQIVTASASTNEAGAEAKAEVSEEAKMAAGSSAAATEEVVAPPQTILEETQGPSTETPGHSPCAMCGVDAVLVTAAMASQEKKASITEIALNRTIESLGTALQAQQTLLKRVEALESGISAASATRIPDIQRGSAAKAVPKPAPKPERTALEKASEQLGARCAELLTASMAKPRGVKRAAEAEPPSEADVLKKRLQELFAK
jgi:hypothetical protein